MTEVASWRRGFQSVTAVIAGFAVTAVLSVAVDALLHALQIFPKWGDPIPDSPLMVALAYRAAFTVLGGYTTARLAPNRPMAHVWTLVYIGFLAATAGTLATWNGGARYGPHWYSIALIVTAIPCILLGGRLHELVQSRAADPARKT